MLSLPVYLDSHATTPADPRVVEAMLPWFSRQFGNPGSHHQAGRKAADAVEHSRASIAALLNCSPEEILFTSGATEADNLALKGFVAASPTPPHIISSQAEHRAILDPLKRLARSDASVTLLPVDRAARISADQIAEALRPDTRLVTLMLANNEIGSLNPLAEISSLCRSREILLHSDATQAVGKIPLDLRQLPLDLVSFSSHKLYGPPGIGALFIRNRDNPIRLAPLLEGGGQERRLRSGTLPVPLIVGFATACELARREMAEESLRLAHLREQLWEKIRSAFPDAVRNTPLREVLPQNLNITFPGIDGEQLLRSLTDIAVSSGAACSSADPRPSHVLRAIGLSEQDAKSSLRFGLGRFTTQEEIDFAADDLIRIVRSLS